ncbi:sialidase family protein [Kutzneria sp. 744]|uniref:sialidase family protein n=1 Tax=Kutzneria sp. (strain 744) TaxID=345341 RepID=UPI0003EED7CA|nr:sialidase family protein [Kutzneria sp. 744]EWM17950.1 BNR/Asp-box repeat protein [Kutzneria sp. 744]
MKKYLVTAVAGLLALAPAIAHADTPPTAVKISTPSPFPAGCDHKDPVGTNYPNAEVQPDIAVDPRNPSHMVSAFQTDRWQGVGGHGLITAATFDGGRTWTYATPPAVSTCSGGAFDRATDTQVSIAPNGMVFLTSLSMNTTTPHGDHALLVVKSGDGGRSWGTPTTITREGTGDTDNIWNDLPTVYTTGKDVYVAWDRINLDDGTGPIYLAHSGDGGTTWGEPRKVVDFGVGKGASGVRLASVQGKLVAFFAYYEPIPGTADYATSWRSITSADLGETWSAPAVAGQAKSVGTKEPGGKNVRDGHDVFGQLAAGPHGELRAVWQGSQFAGDHDGAVMATSTDAGATWSAPVPVGSSPAKQFMPAVAVNSDGVVGVTYYQLDSTGTSYWQATSATGTSWHTTKLSGPFDITAAPVVNDGSYYVGDYHGMAAAGTCFVSVFAKTNSGQPDNRTDVFFTVS